MLHNVQQAADDQSADTCSHSLQKGRIQIHTYVIFSFDMNGLHDLVTIMILCTCFVFPAGCETPFKGS